MIHQRFDYAGSYQRAFWLSGESWRAVMPVEVIRRPVHFLIVVEVIHSLPMRCEWARR